MKDQEGRQLKGSLDKGPLDHFFASRPPCDILAARLFSKAKEDDEKEGPHDATPTSEIESLRNDRGSLHIVLPYTDHSAEIVVCVLPAFPGVNLVFEDNGLDDERGNTDRQTVKGVNHGKRHHAKISTPVEAATAGSENSIKLSPTD